MIDFSIGTDFLFLKKPLKPTDGFFMLKIEFNNTVLLDKCNRLVDGIRYQKEFCIRLGNSPRDFHFFDMLDEIGVKLGIEDNDRKLADLAGLYQCQCLEILNKCTEATRHHDECVGIFYQ